MFDKVSEAAEKVATNVSRRAFLGRLGQGALGVAGVLGSILAFGGKTQAAIGCLNCPRGAYCCNCPPTFGPLCSRHRLDGCICTRL